MKIYTLIINPLFQPASQPFKYPKHNNNYGVEQDFQRYLHSNPHLLTNNSKHADWHYLPIFWTRYFLNHNYAREGLFELQQEVDRVLIDDTKTFTICQYDDGPIVNLGETLQFLASRKTSKGIDIPLLCSQHKMPFLSPKKKYRASFVGKLSTSLLRTQMDNVLRERKDIFLYDGFKGTRFFTKKILSSYIALSPRGYGGSSYRFYEAMQLGVVPLMISDIDTRPFKKFIPWENISFFCEDISEINSIIDRFDTKELYDMGNEAKKHYYNELQFQKWCKYIIKHCQEFHTTCSS